MLMANSFERDGGNVHNGGNGGTCFGFKHSDFNLSVALSPTQGY